MPRRERALAVASYEVVGVDAEDPVPAHDERRVHQLHSGVGTVEKLPQRRLHALARGAPDDFL